MYRRVAAACAISIAVLWAPASAGTGQIPAPAPDTSVPADVSRTLTRAVHARRTRVSSVGTRHHAHRGLSRNSRGLGPDGRDDQHHTRSSGGLLPFAGGLCGRPGDCGARRVFQTACRIRRRETVARFLRCERPGGVPAGSLRRQDGRRHYFFGSLAVTLFQQDSSAPKPTRQASAEQLLTSMKQQLEK
jgi:hypothetical protein